MTIRVLMTTDTIGAVWTYSCELIAALAPRDVHVTLATMGARLDHSQARMVNELRNVDVLESDYRLEWMQDAWIDVDAAGDWLVQVADRVQPDVVHVNGYSHAVLPFRAPVVCVAHSCVCTWYRAVRDRDAGPEWSTYRERVAAGLRAAKTVVAPTAAILRDILAEYNVSPAATRVIPNACDPEKWPRGDKEPFVISVGRMWDEAKNLGIVDACAQRLAWPVYIAGSSKAPGGWVVETQGVKVLGELAPDALAGWLSRASIYVHPAKYEPFGLAPAQAALAGCALVLGNIPSLREVWGDAAVYVPVSDAHALEATISGLMADPLRRRALATAARKRALTLAPAGLADAYHGLYSELASGTREVA